VLAWEATNLLTVAAAVVSAAWLREESRGCHWRSDFEDRRESWHAHTITWAEEGLLRHQRVASVSPELVAR
jgi:L-aspartate oxidase